MEKDKNGRTFAKSEKYSLEIRSPGVNPQHPGVYFSVWEENNPNYFVLEMVQWDADVPLVRKILSVINSPFTITKFYVFLADDKRTITGIRKTPPDK
ncbi:MAG TPA: hypothetical protein VKA15_17670 [Isosphaeraceae bacterium]|nr:hypothetical protein [Isosphaeraceae bacterium]